MMETLKLKARTGDDGRLSVTVPTPLPCEEVEVTLTYRPLPDLGETDANGWPIGWFERTAGSIPDLERPPQGEYEVREEW